MFKEWTFKIKEQLNKGANNLFIHFFSAKNTIDSIANINLPLIRPDNNRVYARKAQFQFGWDWGPTFINAGIFKKIWLDAYDQISTASIIQAKRDELNAKRKKNIKLIQHPDSIGTSFYFEKDGKPIYMKGANWIPADIFLNNANKSTYKRLLQNAKEAHMNMLRVWGGGIYENDEFYDLCDSLGIYVWQDFMFACGMYPADDHFLQNLKDEVFQQISRLRHHPCIVVWCGNNEIDEAWHNWGWQTQYKLHGQDSVKIWQDYQTLFKDSLLAWVNQFDGTRPYIATSPKNGWGHPESFIEGDSHYWGLWWGLEDWEIFKTKTGRFVSEYGMQSMSNYSTVKTYTADTSRYLYSPAILNHQKAADGFKKLNYYLTLYFVDSSVLSRLSLKDYCYITQCMQAFILQNSISTHLSKYPKNMGTLLWQLNDCWPSTSWSIIDYNGNKKAAWYAVKRAFAANASYPINSINRQTLHENQPKFTVKINGEHSISISSTCDAQFVFIEGYDLSDNYFDIKKGETKIIGLNNAYASKQLIKQLKIYSLNQFYYLNQTK
jgi:beta-mannosidase